jgi:hypothetical protein
MIQTFDRNVGALRGLGTTTTVPPRANSLQERSKQ